MTFLFVKLLYTGELLNQIHVLYTITTTIYICKMKSLKVN